MSLNYILNPQDEPLDPPPPPINATYPVWDNIPLGDIPDFDFGDVGDVGDLFDFTGLDQSQNGFNGVSQAVMDSSLNNMNHGLQDWAHHAVAYNPSFPVIQETQEIQQIQEIHETQEIQETQEHQYTQETQYNQETQYPQESQYTQESQYIQESQYTQETDDTASSESVGVLSQPESPELISPQSSNECTPNPEQICYGMIHHVDVKLTGEMENLIAQLDKCQKTSASAIQRFTLHPKNDHILLQLPDGTNFGYPRDNITKVLTSLLHREDLEFEAVALFLNIKRKIAKTNKAGEAIVQVDINVYGPPNKATEIGNTLSEAKAWLQRPDYHKRDVPYENPHVIAFPEFHEVSEPDMLRNEAANLQTDQEPDITRVVEEIQAKTHRAAGLERAQADRRSKTELLEHQEQALTFMLQRESGDIPAEFRLWKPEMVEGREVFIHQITKARSSILPEENGGGILADEMGMGKTLSILSLLLKTTDEGLQWAESKNSEDLTHSDIEVYAQSTLIIVPSALLINSWVKEIQMHIGDAVKVTRYHGDGRERDTRALAKADIVLTTYKTLATDFGSKNKTSPLHSMGWFRVVLDEAHNIRRPATTYHKACVGLNARSRWCLSGTPIQNRLEDIGALFTFLKVEQIHTMARFRWYLVHPYEQRKRVAIDRLIMLYDSVVLRRTKDVLVLPGQENRVKELDLSPEERLQYERTERILNRSIRQFIGEHQITTKFGLFQAHLQLRIFCNHGTHQKLFSWKKSRNKNEGREAYLMELGPNVEKVCETCRQPEPIIASNRFQKRFTDKCNHTICQDCLEEWNEFQGADVEPRCPLCDLQSAAPKNQRSGHAAVPENEDVVMTDANDESEEAGDGYFNLGGYSTKMKALLEDVKETLNETVVQENNRTQKAKSIIFSCWTRTLNLIELYLKRENIEFLRVDGEMLMSRRQRILDIFSEPGGPQIMLMTTGTGAFGLNLTAANRIFIVELQWNPSVEYQAIARAIRLRQKDKVIVTRYLMKGTVEQEMRNQQENKERAARAGFEERDRMDTGS